MDKSSNQPTSKQDYTLVDPLAALIKEQLRELDTRSTDSSIDRVPPELRHGNEKSYTPQIVSIGPFHHGKKELGPWEERKLRYLQAFLEDTQKSLEDCIKLVKDWEDRARSCYNERIDLSSDAFVKMMFLDSCFIIQYMLIAEQIWKQPTYFLSKPEVILKVQIEMILMENQIPFFLLHGLYHYCFTEEGKDKFIELSIEYFSNLLLNVTDEEDVERTFKNVTRYCELSSHEIEHFTDLLRICHLPANFENLRKESGTFVRIPSATRLDEVGFNFKSGTSKYLEYNTPGLLEIPKFKVQGTTECLLKNLIALETCQYTLGSYIIDYVLFTGKLIDTATDVDLLLQKGIIENGLHDSAAVASLFNNLGMETTLFSSYYFKSISEEINAYCSNPLHKVPWHKWKATFKRDSLQETRDVVKENL